MTRIGDVINGSRLEDQIVLETEAIERGVQRYKRLAKEAVDRGDGASLKPAERLLLYWLPPLVEAIEYEKREVLEGKAGKGRHVFGSVILECPAEKIAVIAMNEMLGHTMREINGVLMPKIAYAIGNAVIAEIHQGLLKAGHRDSLDELDRRFKRRTVGRVNWWAKKTLDDPLWNRKVCVHLGAKVLDLAIHLARVNSFDDKDTVPAFIHEKVWRDNQKKGVIRLSEEAMQVIEDGHLHRQHLRPRFLPMVVPPYPWQASEDGIGEGGYIQVRTPFMCKPTREQTKELMDNPPAQVLEALNAINATSLCVNKKILAVQEAVWNQGGGLPGIPTADLRPLPPKPANISTDEAVRKAWKRQAHEVHSHNAKLRGARVEFIQTLELAKRMASEGQFWLCYQYDFRFRFYPIPLYLNFTGADYSRSLLLFHRRRPVTKKGMRWIKIHAANKYGYDKADFDGRVAFIDNMMPMLERVAEDPLEHVKVWSEADEPWQFLAAVFALFDEEIAARFPVQADGSCNGIQHYAAAGRDEIGAEAVNLIPGDTPNDAYLDVLHAVVHRVQVDAKGGDPTARMILPLLQNEDKGRVVVKQPVMCTPYNVTRVGARDMVKEKLKKFGHAPAGIFKTSDYLATTIFNSVGDVCVGAREIMSWLEGSVRAMCKADKFRTVRWQSPLGATVIQPYRNFRKHKIETVMQWVTLAERDDLSEVSLRRQVQGGPPNWVHSQDGGHAQSTAIRCYEEDIDAAFIHDGYLTHAETMDEMNVILREEFVEQHLMDQVGITHKYWTDRYPGVDLPDPPAKGSLDLNVVRDSKYFFA